jgi:DNA-binding response OmpR family regulator
MRALEAKSLRQEGFNVVECQNGWELLEHIGWYLDSKKNKYEHYDLIVTDIRMPGVTGLEILEGLHQTEGFPPMILVTAFGDDQVHTEARMFGAAAMIDKPFEMSILLGHVSEVFKGSKDNHNYQNQRKNIK